MAFMIGPFGISFDLNFYFGLSSKTDVCPPAQILSGGVNK
jgi:hypothetical protein